MPIEIPDVVIDRLPLYYRLLARLEQLAQDYADQHTADAWLPRDKTHALSLNLAVRNWEPRLFAALRRRSS